VTIALDATYGMGERLSGVGVYSREMLLGLAAAHPEERFWYCCRLHRYFRALRETPPNVRRRLLAEPIGPRGADLFHGLNQRLPRLRLRRAVATFHDLFVMTGEYSTPEFRARFTAQARDAAARADAIIAVSEFTKSQVVDLLGVEAARVRVVHHGVRGVGGESACPTISPPRRRDAEKTRNGLAVGCGSCAAEDIRAAEEAEDRGAGAVRDNRSAAGMTGHEKRWPAPLRESCPTKIVLHVGAIQKRKNVARLVAAFEALDPEWKLVLAGSFGYGAEEIRARIDASPARARISTLGYVAPGDLAQWYARATIFAFPSLDEGFGMPVLEAMAAGAPVLTSNRAALPEVAGDAALLVNPEDTGAVTHALRELAGNEKLRRDLAARGLERARTFTWERAVRETWDVYQELLNSG
jgi:glycosyltransferase involved in cell wall biosynthesis